MQKQPKLWEILAAFLPIIIGITTWVYNIGTTQVKQEARLKAVEETVQQVQQEYKADMKEIKASLQAILIRLGPEKYQLIKK
jgi:hypothetical protein